MDNIWVDRLTQIDPKLLTEKQRAWIVKLARQYIYLRRSGYLGSVQVFMHFRDRRRACALLEEHGLKTKGTLTGD